MPTYRVYQQRPPIKTGRLDALGYPIFESNLTPVGMVEAYSGPHAIDLARETISAFRMASRATLAAFPIVELHRSYFAPADHH